MWYETRKQLPPEGVLLDVITESNDERQLIFEHNLFWLPNKEMYVYFTPKLWKEAN
jgi:hypothetical protein